MIVSMKIHVAITTFNRLVPLQKLLNNIADVKGNHEIDIHVYDDASEDYQGQAINSSIPLNWHTFYKNNGKRGYWRVIDRAFQDASQHVYDYFFLLQDDCELVPDFFDRAISEWEGIEDKKKATYCVFTPTTIYNRVMWGGKAKDVSHGNQMYIKGDYVDCIFMCPRKTLEKLEFHVKPIPEDFWDRNPNKSSGVGMQLTRRLNELKLNMYTAYDSLVITGDVHSKMNPLERRKNPLKSLVRAEFHVEQPSKIADIYAGIASIPHREEALFHTLISLTHQVKTIYVALNGYKRIPHYADQFKNVEFELTDNERGDANKFRKVHEVKGYFLTCDDDIVYPENYAEKMIAKLEKHGQAIISCHGRSVYQKPIKSFYNDTHQYHFIFRQREDIRIHIPGTGVTAFHTADVPITLDYFETANMADIWLGKFAEDYGIPVYCVARPQKWLKATKIPEDVSIYRQHKGKDAVQAKLVNDTDWTPL